MRIPPTVAAALITAQESDVARKAEYDRRTRRARRHETEPTRRRRAVWARAARAPRSAADPA
jgi:hypothetical protein